MIAQSTRTNGYRPGQHSDGQPDDAIVALSAARQEMAAVGSCMLDAHLLDSVLAVASRDRFQNPWCRHALQALEERQAAGLDVDTMAIAQRIVELDGLADFNRVSEWVIEAFECVPHGMHAVEYAEAVVEAWKRRQMSQAGIDLQRLARDPSIEADESIGRHADQIARLSDGVAVRLQVGIRDTIGETLEAVVSGDERVIPTGYPEIDQTLGGLRPGHLATLAARPAMGKTAFALCLAARIAKAGTPVGFVTHEMSVRELEKRLLVQFSRVPAARMRNANAADRFAMAEAASELSALPIFWDERSSNLDQVIASLRRMKRAHGCEIAFIDYLQLIAPMDTRQIREQQVSSITRKLKTTARELGICIVALSQLSRALELRTVKIPQLSDLRESGSIEQDSDVVLFLHRPHVYDQREPETNAVVIVAKQRSGPTGAAALEWRGWCTEFVSPVQEGFR